MKNILITKVLFANSNPWRLVIVTVLTMMVASCGKESDDGEVSNGLTLPGAGDNVLNLYCQDFGLFQNKCVLDDPENPYATVKFTDQNKFDLEMDAATPKARVYLWASALAGSSTGENQYYTARSLYQLYNLSDSDVIKNQAIRAYRSVLDNYFADVTFFSTGDFGVLPAVFYPVQLRELTAATLIDGIDPAWPASNLFFDDADDVRNDFLSRVKLNEWGYFYDDTSGQVFKK